MNSTRVEEIFNLTIHDLGHHGEGIGYHQGYTVFVEGALPTEVVKVQLFYRQKKFGKANLLEILQPSIHRRTPPCPLFSQCGGCQLMHLSYEQQLEIKTKRVIEALKRIGKLEKPPVLPCLPSPIPLHYRNKIQLPIRSTAILPSQKQIGFYTRHSHQLIDIPACLIHAEIGEAVYVKVRQLIQDSSLTAYDPLTHQGVLRHLLIKTAFNQREVLVILVTTAVEQTQLLPLAHQIQEACPTVKGVIQNVNTRTDNVILGQNYHVLTGSSFVIEKIGALSFKVSPASFFQVNPQQAIHLYQKALELADLTGQEIVLDAYCGVGTLALFFAKQVKQVIGVECVPQAIEDAQYNAALNQIENAHFICTLAEEFIQNFSFNTPFCPTTSCIDLVILNPPRSGCDKNFLKNLVKLKAKKIIYISCDPATLARDLLELSFLGYVVDVVQPFDMFPQTAHVECLVRLILK